MKVMILTPSFLPSISGNARTVARWAQGLAQAGHEVSVADLGADPEGRRLAGTLREFQPDLLHAHHALKAGRFLAGVDPGGGRPWVVSFAGTDVAALAAGQGEAASILRVCARAARLFAQARSTEQTVKALLAELAQRVSFVPKSVYVGQEAYPLRERLQISPDQVLFFFPAGLRRVKNQRGVLGAFGRLRENCPEAVLTLAGPVLEPDYAREVEAECARSGVVRLEIPPGAMGGAYGEADVVLNASTLEGFANAVLEAMSCGKPVLASRIPANEEAVEDGRTGMLYSNEAEFLLKAERLAKDPALRRKLGEAARFEVQARYNPGREMEGLLKVYEEALSGRRIE